MTTLIEGRHEGEFIGEHAMHIGFHVEPITVLADQNLRAGAVLGAVPAGTSASAARAGGNTGNGTFTLNSTTPILPGAMEGVYRLRCIAAATNGGTFRLEAPNGVVLGDFVMAAGAATVAEHIQGALADGATDFIVGDGFDITVSALTYKFVEFDPAATNGGQIVSGILMQDTNATGADKRATAVVRGPITVNANDLVWKSGLSADQRTTALGTLLHERLIQAA